MRLGGTSAVPAVAGDDGAAYDDDLAFLRAAVREAAAIDEVVGELGMSLFEVSHPLVQHHLTRMRDATTPSADFRLLVHRLASLLAYEATKDLRVKPCEVQTPLAVARGQRLTQRIGLIPILRAGLGMVDPVLHVVPDAEVWHLGVYRDEVTARPVEYYRKIPHTGPVDVALILDPMLATGGSAGAAIGTVRSWGVPVVKLLSIIAARPGVDAIRTRFPETTIFVCAVDPELNSDKFIIPGLGDAGDRMFRTLGS